MEAYTSWRDMVKPTAPDFERSRSPLDLVLREVLFL